MSNENMSENTTGSEGGGEDLSASLAGGETEFVGTSEEKKPLTTQYAVLAGVVLLAPRVIWYMYKGKGPDAASGAAAQQQSPASQTVHTFLDSGQDGVAAMRKMLQGTEKIVKEFLAYPSMAQIPLDELRTNPFRAQQQAADDGSAASNRKRDAEREKVVKAVQALQLQSIMSGKRGACMINNTLYTEGERVGQFTIEKISQASVIVKSGQYRFELKMQK